MEATARTVSLAVAEVGTHAPGLVRLVVRVPVVRRCLLARRSFPQRIAELEERRVGQVPSGALGREQGDQMCCGSVFDYLCRPPPLDQARWTA